MKDKLLPWVINSSYDIGDVYKKILDMAQLSDGISLLGIGFLSPRNALLFGWPYLGSSRLGIDFCKWELFLQMYALYVIFILSLLIICSLIAHLI